MIAGATTTSHNDEPVLIAVRSHIEFITEHITPEQPPPGLALLLRFKGKNFKQATYRSSVLLLTFLCYACFHCARKIPSVVKSTLDPSPSDGSPGWYPFNSGAHGKELLAGMDTCFLAMYACGMFFTGHLADSVDLRKFLCVGCVLTGSATCVYGAAQLANVHAVPFFYAMMLLMGLCQSTAYPAVVAVVANWFGPAKRGLIMGVWAAHMMVGNIVGSVLGSYLLQFGWGWCFLIPGIVLIFMGGVLLLFLTSHPEDVGYPSPTNPHHHHHPAARRQHRPVSDRTEPADAALCGLLSDARNEPKTPSVTSDLEMSDSESEWDPREGLPEPPVAFCTAVMIPGVITYSLCLFFSKLINYTFLFWLPFYISNSEIGNERLTPSEAGRLSSMFDIGGVLGGILIGHLADRMEAKASTTTLFLTLSVPMLFAYRSLGTLSIHWNKVLLFGTGTLVNGPYALITTAISADLGTHESLQGNAQALATVTAIIDGTGSLGAVVGPLLTGFITQVSNDWNDVFYMLYAASVAAALLLMRLVAKELGAKLRSSHAESFAAESLLGTTASS